METNNGMALGADRELDAYATLDDATQSENYHRRLSNLRSLTHDEMAEVLRDEAAERKHDLRNLEI